MLDLLYNIYSLSFKRTSRPVCKTNKENEKTGSQFKLRKRCIAASIPKKCSTVFFSPDSVNKGYLALHLCYTAVVPLVGSQGHLPTLMSFCMFRGIFLGAADCNLFAASTAFLNCCSTCMFGITG